MFSINWSEKGGRLLSIVIALASFLVFSLIFNNWDYIFH